MFGKFTPQAKRVVSLAEDEARRLENNYVGTEHLLLGLLREDDGVAAHVLAQQGVELAAVRQWLEQVIGRGSIGPATNTTWLTPRSKLVIKLAEHEALHLGHDAIGTEHLLLGLLREGQGIAVGALQFRGVRLDGLRQATLDALREHDERP